MFNQEVEHKLDVLGLPLKLRERADVRLAMNLPAVQDLPLFTLKMKLEK